MVETDATVNRFAGLASEHPTGRQAIRITLALTDDDGLVRAEHGLYERVVLTFEGGLHVGEPAAFDEFVLRFHVAQLTDTRRARL